MSPVVAIVLAVGLTMEAAGLRRAPVPSFSPKQMHQAVEDVRGLINGSWCFVSFKTESNATMLTQKGIPLPGDGQPLPEGQFDFKVEDFNPDALKRTPCGIVTEKPERLGKGVKPVAQARLVTALKLWVGMLTEDRKIEYDKACKKMDPYPAGGKADDKVSAAEFKAWTNAQPFDGRVESEDGQVIIAIFDVLKDKGQDSFTLVNCAKNLKTLVEKLS